MTVNRFESSDGLTLPKGNWTNSVSQVIGPRKRWPRWSRHPLPPVSLATFNSDLLPLHRLSLGIKSHLHCLSISNL